MCTYQRPQLLDNCLKSILNQQSLYPFEIIVIDNDAFQTAKPIVDIYTENVKYISCFDKGLSNARNMAVQNANGEFVLFIDDDEVADENWLENILITQRKFDADAVFGRVIYKIPNTYPSFIRNSKYFNRKRKLTGLHLQLNEGYSGNTLIRKSLFSLRNPPFDPKYNFSGGEDTDFFNFLLKLKYRLIYCDEAVIYETQDLNRVRLRWYYNRGYNSGREYVGTILRSTQTRKLAKIFQLCINLIFSFLLIMAYISLSVVLFNWFFLVLWVRFSSFCGKLNAFIKFLFSFY